MVAVEDPLVAAIHQFEDVLARDANSAPTSWFDEMHQALHEIENVLAAHKPLTAKTVKEHEELQRREISPTIARSTRSLRDDQRAMLVEIDALISQLQRNAVRPDDIPALQQIGGKLVKSLQKFCATENALLFDNVLRDTGAGD